MERINFFGDDGYLIGLTGQVDRENGVIRGVSLITSGLQARGHDLHVDEKTCQQILECARKMKKVPVKWNHKTGADAVNGYIENCFVADDRSGLSDQKKTLGDWHLLKTHSQYAQALELAERMPECIGLSAAFVGKEETIEGKKFARCEELLSVDLVAQPAANPDGLFEEVFGKRVDTNNKHEMSKPSAGKTAAGAAAGNAAQEPTLADVMTALAGIGERLKPLEDFQTQINDQLNQPTLEDFAQMTDEQLAEYNVTRDQVNEAVEAAIANGDLEAPNGEVAVGEGADGVIDGNAAGAGAGAGAAAGAAGAGAGASAGAGAGAGGGALAALRNDVTNLARLVKGQVRGRQIEMARKQTEQVEHAFEVIENKVTELTAKNEELTTENETLRVALDSASAKAAAAGVSDNATFFSAESGDEFEKRVAFHMSSDGGNKKATEAVLLAIKDNPEAHRKYLANKGARPAK